MWHTSSPWFDKILPILVYTRKTLGPLGRNKRSKFNNEAEFEDRNDSYSAIGL